MSRRPEWIKREEFRAWLTGGQINKLVKVGGITAQAFIARCERHGRPIASRLACGGKRWRPLDVAARASAECLEITQNEDFAPPPPPPATMEELREAHRLAVALVSTALTGKTLLKESEIVAGSLPRMENTSGVYFLVKGKRVRYVGQSINVPSRITQHTEKDFDRIAVIECPRAGLDILESLYIHALRPPDNGGAGYTGVTRVCAPIALDVLMRQMAAGASKNKPRERRA